VEQSATLCERVSIILLTHRLSLLEASHVCQSSVMGEVTYLVLGHWHDVKFDSEGNEPIGDERTAELGFQSWRE
jgi:hypothetical protein